MDVLRATGPASDSTVKAIYDYQNGLIARRWNVFIGYLVANGLMLNVLREMRADGGGGELVELAVAVSGVALSALFLQLISVLLQRIVATYRLTVDQNADLVVVGVGEKGSRILSITGLLYLIILVLGLPWFFAMGASVARVVGGPDANIVATTITLTGFLMYIASLRNLTWPDRGYIESLRVELEQRRRAAGSGVPTGEGEACPGDKGRTDAS